MREILFRGKRDDNNEWVYGAFVPDATEQTHGDMVTWGFIRYYDKSSCKMVTVEVNRETVGQFTGLTDKNGVKIFEGDVLKDSLGWVFEVIWDGDNGRFLGHHSKSRGDCYICYVGMVDKHNRPSTEAIGNIHDNPELMGGNENV